MYLWRPLVQNHALRGEGFFTACRVLLEPHLLGKQVAVCYCPRGINEPSSRGKRENHKASLVSLFCCFVVIASGIKKETSNVFQFCAGLQVLERKFVSVQGWSEQRSALGLLLPCFSFTPAWDYFCLQVWGNTVKRVWVLKVNLGDYERIFVSNLLVIRIDGTAVNILILLLVLQCVQTCEVWMCFTFYCFKILGFSSSSMPSQMLLSKQNPSFIFSGMLCVSKCDELQSALHSLQYKCSLMQWLEDHAFTLVQSNADFRQIILFLPFT